MKARSVVFSQLQRPTTVFGMPPKMVGIDAGVSVVFYLLTLLFGAISISILGSGLLFAAGLSIIYHCSRADHHIETLWSAGFGFWGVSTRRRWLLAGAPVPRSRDGRS